VLLPSVPSRPVITRKAKSFLIDGEAVVCRPDGLSDFDARFVLDGERMK
jgi:hypothetical protein